MRRYLVTWETATQQAAFIDTQAGLDAATVTAEDLTRWERAGQTTPGLPQRRVLTVQEVPYVEVED